MFAIMMIGNTDFLTVHQAFKSKLIRFLQRVTSPEYHSAYEGFSCMLDTREVKLVVFHTIEV